MKNQHLLYALLTLMAFGLITACSKSSNSTPTPNSPIAGEFDINRREYTDFPASYTVYNSVVTSTTALGTDVYIFNNDNSFTNKYNVQNSAGATVLNTDTGVYSYLTSTSTITITPTTSSPYVLYYNSTTNEVYTGKIAVQDSLTNPGTGVKQLVTYNVNLVYKKK